MMNKDLLKRIIRIVFWCFLAVVAAILAMLVFVQVEMRFFSEERQDIVTIVHPTIIDLAYNIPDGRSTRMGYFARFPSGIEREIFLPEFGLKAGDKLRISYMETSISKAVLVGECEVLK